MYYKKKILISMAALVLISCASALYIPTSKDALAQNTSLEKLQQGRALYINRCGSCHNLYLPSSYTGKAWKPIMDKMQKRAQIDDSQKELINNYLGTTAKK
jgi:hypothetical protein